MRRTMKRQNTRTRLDMSVGIFLPSCREERNFSFLFFFYDEKIELLNTILPFLTNKKNNIISF